MLEFNAAVCVCVCFKFTCEYVAWGYRVVCVCVCVCVCVRICTSTCCHDRRKQQRRGSPSAQSDIKNNIPSLHVGSMSPQQGAHACMINGSMYVCWLHIPLMLVMRDIFQPLTKLSSLKIRGQLCLLLSMQISVQSLPWTPPL